MTRRPLCLQQSSCRVGASILLRHDTAVSGKARRWASRAATASLLGPPVALPAAVRDLPARGRRLPRRALPGTVAASRRAQAAFSEKGGS